MIGISFFKAYLIHFHPTDGVQCGIGKLNSSAETLNLRKEAGRGEREEGGAACRRHQPWRGGSIFVSSVSAHSRRETFDIGYAKVVEYKTIRAACDRPTVPWWF